MTTYLDLLNTVKRDLTVYDDPTSPNPPHPLLLPDFKKDTLIGDGLREYPSIAQSINMDFHPCLFHKLFTPNQEIWKHQSIINKKIESLENKKEKNQRTIDKKSLINKGKIGRIPHFDKKRRNAKDKITTLKIENHGIDTKIRKLKKNNIKNLRIILKQYRIYSNQIILKGLSVLWCTS